MEDYFSFLKDKENIMLLLDGLTFVAGLFALWLFYRRNRSFEKQVDTAQKQAETSEKNLFNDRLSRAIEALGTMDNLAVRNAGLRLIDSLIKDTHADTGNRILLLDILHGYIRDRAVKPSRDEDGNLPDTPSRETRTDIELAIKILFDRVQLERHRQYPLNNLDLRGLQLFEFDLRRANLKRANLQGADLHEAEFQRANLNRANLEGADLHKAEFQGANLEDANLQDANLKGAKLQVANLSMANLQEAYLETASLEQAVLRYVNLQGSVLMDANLQRAYLSNANLQGADLRISLLPYADLWRANLQGANLEDANLKGASTHMSDITIACLEDAHSFTQEQLDVCIYENQKPPLGLLQGLELPADRAYEWAKNENGHMCRRFVHNKEWIDEITPWWYKENEDA